MTFQRATARRIIALIRSIAPTIRIVVGGYDPSLAPGRLDASGDRRGLHRARRGRADVPRSRPRARAARCRCPTVPGLWYRDGSTFHRNRRPARLTSIEDGTLRPPNRAARVLSGYTMLGRGVDVVETSRGCTYDCSFCSIIEMRGRNFHRFPIPRVLDDIRDARRRGARVDLLRRRQHHDRRPAVRSAVPRHRRGGPERHRLHRAGHDGADCRARRDARAADEAGGLPLRVPRHRERARRGSRVSQGAGEEQPARGGPPQGERDAGRDRRPAPQRPAGRRRADRRQPGRHERVCRREPDVRARARRLAVHPASDAVSRDADDARVSRTGSDREPPRRRVRRHDRRDAQRAPGRRRDRVHAVARGALDEGASHGERPSATIRGSCCATAAACSPTRFAARRGAPRWGWRASAPRSRATARSGAASAATSIGPIRTRLPRTSTRGKPARRRTLRCCAPADRYFGDITSST